MPRVFVERCFVVSTTGGKVKEDGHKVSTPGVVGCIASVVLSADYRLNWTVSSVLGSDAINVTECAL